MLHSQASKFLHVPLSFSQFPIVHTRSLNTLTTLFNLCSSRRQLEQVHARFILHGLQQNQALASKLVDGYAKLGLFSAAQRVFDFVLNPNADLFHKILGHLFSFGEYKRVLLVYVEMVRKSMFPDEETYPCVLRSCCCLSDIEYGKRIHGHIVKLGFHSFDSVATALAELYADGGGFQNDREGFEEKSVKDLDYWNYLISEASQNGKAEETFRLFKDMRMENHTADCFTAINLLRSSVYLHSLNLGKLVHCLLVVSNLSGDLSVTTAVLSMYAKVGSLADARLLFDKMPEKDLVVWNVMISAYSREGEPREALELVKCMARSRLRADLFTSLPAISSISQLKCIEWGKQMHAHVIRTGSDHQNSVHNSLIDMYCCCGSLDSALKVFDLVTEKTVVAWSAIIKGHVRHDQNLNALSLFSKMKSEGIRADFITVINILPACVNMGALENVRYLHGHSMKLGLCSLASVNTALLISYAKCGCIAMAKKLFEEERVDSKDKIMWNSMISAHSKHGDWSHCFKLYNRMKESHLKPDPVTFLGLLTACVNSGLVEEGKECFKEMTETYGCQPVEEHYACMVDLLGRAGRIIEAREFVKSMPMKPDARVWGALLSACKKHSETGVAEFAAEKLISMEPKNAGNYILLSNIYAAAGKWDGVAKMRSVLRDEGLKKIPGCSWLEINGRVHEFRVADRSHPRCDDIYTILGHIELEVKEDREKNTQKL